MAEPDGHWGEELGIHVAVTVLEFDRLLAPANFCNAIDIDLLEEAILNLKINQRSFYYTPSSHDQQLSDVHEINIHCHYPGARHLQQLHSGRL